MFRSIPVANKICFDKDLKRQWRIHEKKLRELKSSIDSKEPQTYDFLITNPKKEEIIDTRNAQIMRENQVLLSKISNITVQGSISRQLKKCKSVALKKTLNEPFRRRCLEQIGLQNQSMLKRIQGKKSCYNTKKMAKDRAEIEKNIHLISYFPYKDYKKNKTQVNLWMTDAHAFRPEQSTISSENILTIPHEVKKTRKIGDCYFLITCFHVNHQFNIALQNLQQADQKYHLQMEQVQAVNFLRTYFSNSIEKMIDALSIDEKEKVCYLKYQIKDQGKDQKQSTSEGADKQACQ